MKTHVLIGILTFATICGPALASRTLTFDDVPAGTQLSSSSLYRDAYRVRFDSYFRATDHSSSLWGPPVSGTNVLTCSYAGSGAPLLLFGTSGYNEKQRDPVASVSACFSTQPGVQVRLSLYRTPSSGSSTFITSFLIGDSAEAWTNQLVTLSSPDSFFTDIWFEGVNSPNDLLGFCADDMTITYVPEPSSLLVLSGGFGILGLLTRRQRRASVST